MSILIMNREEEIEERASEYAQYDAFANCNIDDVWRGFVEGAQWADEHPVSPWHSVADGNLPPNNTYCLFPSIIDEFEVGYVQNGYVHFNDTEKPCPLKDIEYWMEIPKLPTE